MLGSKSRLLEAKPKLGVLLWPISLSCAMLSPLLASATLLHPVPAALMSQSNQFRVSEEANPSVRLYAARLRLRDIVE